MKRTIPEIKAALKAGEVITELEAKTESAHDLFQLWQECLVDIKKKEALIENLSMFVRKLVRYANTREPSVACEKILEAFEKGQHLLTPTSPLRAESESK